MVGLLSGPEKRRRGGNRRSPSASPSACHPALRFEARGKRRSRATHGDVAHRSKHTLLAARPSPEKRKGERQARPFGRQTRPPSPVWRSAATATPRGRTAIRPATAGPERRTGRRREEWIFFAGRKAATRVWDGATLAGIPAAIWPLRASSATPGSRAKSRCAGSPPIPSANRVRRPLQSNRDAPWALSCARDLLLDRARAVARETFSGRARRGRREGRTEEREGGRGGGRGGEGRSGEGWGLAEKSPAFRSAQGAVPVPIVLCSVDPTRRDAASRRCVRPVLARPARLGGSA